MVFSNNQGNATTGVANDNYEEPITLRNIPNE